MDRTTSYHYRILPLAGLYPSFLPMCNQGSRRVDEEISGNSDRRNQTPRLPLVLTYRMEIDRTLVTVDRRSPGDLWLTTRGKDPSLMYLTVDSDTLCGPSTGPKPPIEVVTEDDTLHHRGPESNTWKFTCLFGKR